jgi:hypothetical protein
VGGELRIELRETGADTARLDMLIRQLYQELRQLDVDEVSTVAAEGPPAGARALDAAAVEAILVAVGTALQGLSAAIMLARDWRRREPEGAPRRVVLSLDGDVLELTGATPGEDERLVSLFLERHAPKAPG